MTYAASYITPAEAKALGHLDDEPSVPQVERASRLVVRATRGARYALAGDGSGYPARADLLDACKRAAAVQVAAWVEADVTSPGAPVIVQGIASKSAGGASVTYLTDPAAQARQAALAAGDRLVPDALDILADVGLLSTRVVSARIVASPGVLG